MHHDLGLVWFRSDLRIQDNPALYQASKHCSQVIGAYLLFPEQWRLQHDSPNKLYFWMKNLSAPERAACHTEYPSSGHLCRNIRQST